MRAFCISKWRPGAADKAGFWRVRCRIGLDLLRQGVSQDKPRSTTDLILGSSVYKPGVVVEARTAASVESKSRAAPALCAVAATKGILSQTIAMPMLS
jgi:hypothetical protein